jgi:hypothetical protein
VEGIDITLPAPPATPPVVVVVPVLVVEPLGATLVFCFRVPSLFTYSSTLPTVITNAALDLSLAATLALILVPRDFVVAIAFRWAGDPMPDLSLA